jgi:hypothetical protein
MQGPHHRLAVIKDLADIPEREQPLIDPRQMDYIRLLVFRQRSDIRTRTSRIDFEEMLPFEMQVTENAPPFPEEMEPVESRMGQLYDRDALGLLVSNEHLRFHAIVVQCFHQAVGCHGCPTRFLTCIDNQYPHNTLPFLCKDTANREKYKINIEDFIFISEVQRSLYKDTANREKYTI